MCVKSGLWIDRRLIFMGCVAAFACLAPSSAWAHTSLEKYLRESVHISVSAGNVDITMQFSFPADLSLTERRRMDGDQDGRVSKDEQSVYLKQIEAQAERLLRLSVGGQAATLIPLDDPKLDLQDTDRAEAHSHELRLAYFARIPEGFGVGGMIALDSGLWTNIPLMVSVSTEGADGIRFQTRDAKGLRAPEKTDSLFRVTEARCTKWDPVNHKKGRK